MSGITVGVSLILTIVLWSGFWQANRAICHATVEISCVLVSSALFCAMWYTYERNSATLNIMGLGFLVVTVLEIMHLIYTPELGMQPKNYADLGTRYWLVSRAVQAVIIFAVILVPCKIRFNKWLGLGLALMASFLLSSVTRHLPSIMPVLYVNGQGATFTKFCFNLALITVSLLTLVLLKKRPSVKDVLTYKYICLALIIVILSDLSLAFCSDKLGFLRVFGHVTKTFYFYYLFKGIVVSAVTYPYKKMETANTYMSKILNGLPLGLLTFDSDDCITFANIKARELFGYHSDEVKQSEELKESFVNGFSADNPLLMPVRDGNPEQRDKAKSRMVKTKNRQGAEINLRVSQLALGDESYMLLVTDIKKEQELESIQLQTQTVLDSVTNLVLLIDKNKKIIRCNKAFLGISQVSEEDILGMTLTEAAALVGCSWRNTPSEDSLEDRLGKAFEITLVTSLGQKKEIVFDFSPVYNVETELIGYVCMGVDVTKIKAEQQRLQHQEKLAVLGQMAAGIVHEIKNPLTAIKGFSQIIKAQTMDERLKSYVNIIETEANGVNQVVSDFLTFAKPRPPVLKAASVNSIIASLCLIIESQLFIKNIAFKKDICQSDMPVLADEDQLKQVILNMVKNAIDATADTAEPVVLLSTRYDQLKGEMVIILSDNGKGMAPNEISRVGTPFYTTKDAGTGLGLSVCLQIIKQHGGRIDIEAEKGRGATFSIILPCIDGVDKRQA
ncbi:MASE3 domain-containing protein [Phosphitispora fastidiosa]|uniref:MASE3 domain-containing protein n=1 Tax=Phosphitispora fastidiosa TaxID=2837202 RepID=UPI001E567085|nr:MASE3 domain-containing protein [Phosphitispora fastidiosa]MBU7007947.1 PAS domain S-box-containing protein [Phosphitispora fastidiosa]